MRALIVEQGYSRGAVAAARALTAAGWFVGVGSPGGRGLASVSRACRARHDVPAAHVASEPFLQAVEEAVGSGRYEVVFGAGEAEVLALSASRADISAVVPHASHDRVMAALDKSRVEKAAESTGLRVPATLDVDALTDEDEPVIVKATVHAHPDRPGAPPRVDTNLVIGATAARQRVKEIGELGAEPRVERFHEGALLAYSAVTDEKGRVVADSMQIASRIWPPGAGASARAVTVEVDESIAERAAALFKELGWFGLAELQFIVPDGDEPRLIDLNGRFYGSMCLAAAAGVNMPATWAALATGRAAASARARPGVRYQWLEGDLRRAWARRSAGWARELASCLWAAPGAAHSLSDIRDPGPLIAQLAQIGKTSLRARLKPRY